MFSFSWFKVKYLVMALIASALLSLPVSACGGDDEATPTATTAPVAKPTTAPTTAPVAKPTTAPTTAPVAKPTTAPTSAPAKVGPSGTLNIGFKELFAFGNSPRLTESAVLFFSGTSSGETLLKLNIDKELVPQLVTEWTLDDSGTVWTLKVRDDVEFHKGWGKFTADDVIFTLEEYANEDTISTWLGTVQRIYAAEGGGPAKVDDYTLTVDTVTPQFDFLYFMIIPDVLQAISKKNYETEGQEVAQFQGIGTGPWEFVESSTREFWKFEAVEGHYRKTPEFAELVLWDIPEEATRVANFEAGTLDSFVMSFDSKPRVDQVPGIRYMSIPNGATTAIHLHPNHYVGMGTDPDFAEKRPAAAACLAQGNCPWMSANPDINSPEWERARKVREAMLISIDREEIVDTLLGGEGTPQSLWVWENRQKELDPDLRQWEFNPERARQLLKETGEEDGFEIEITTSIRGVAAEEEACEAIGDYWGDIGIRTKINRVPYLNIGPRLSAREYTGLNCHGTGGRVDPATLYDILYSSKAGFSAGFDHPIMDDLLTRMFGIADDEGHWAIMNEMARFIYENALDSGFYSVNILFPLGPKVDSWREHLQQGRPDALGSYEFAKPRKQ